jgi:hypothetical protein
MEGLASASKRRVDVGTGNSDPPSLRRALTSNDATVAQRQPRPAQAEVGPLRLSTPAPCRRFSATSSRILRHGTKTSGNSSSTAKQTATPKTTPISRESSAHTTQKRGDHSPNGSQQTQRPRRQLPRSSHPRDSNSPWADEVED